MRASRTISRLQGRRGFTLVEMLAAAIVISMLLAALVGFSHTTARQVKRAGRIRKQFPSTAILREQITRDVRNADGFTNLGSGVVLFGALASNPATGQGTHKLAQVTYRIDKVRGLNVLVRAEQSGQGGGHRRIVWMDAGSISFQPVGGQAVVGSKRGLNGALSPMSPAIDVSFFDADGTTILGERIRHHREIQ
ncbi:MAG: type II secretion system protein [Planctomycetaceae bacterium]